MTDPPQEPAGRPAPSPLAAPVRIAERADGRAVSAFRLDPGEPVLAGHYPGFPIFPGVCLVECAHLTALAALPAGGPTRLAAVESARFLGPVFPGDTVHTEVTAQAVDGGWRCQVRLAAGRAAGDGGRRDVATVRLHYGTGAA